MVQFTNALALLSLGLVPLIILLHIFSSKKKSVVKFSMTAFIPKGKIKTINLQNIILIILQMVIISFLAFSWAQPESEGDYSPKDSVLLIDVSDSMNAKGSDISKIGLAKERAKELINSSEDISFSIATLGSDTSFVCEKTSNKTLLYEKIDSLYAKSESSDLTNSLANVLSSYSDEYIYIITDGDYTSSDIEGALSYIDDESISIEIISNSTSERVDIKDIEIIDGSSSFDISFLIESDIDQSSQEVQISLLVDNISYYSSDYTIYDGETQIEINDISVGNSNQHKVEIEVLKNNTLLGVGRAVFGNEEVIKVLLCEDEIRQDDYLKAALSIEDNFEVFRCTDISWYNLSNFNLVVLCDMPYSNFSQSADELENYAQNGGGILITGGSNIDASYNNLSFFKINYTSNNYNLPLGLVSYKNTSHEIITKDDGHGELDLSSVTFDRINNVTINDPVEIIFSVDNHPLALAWDYNLGKIMFVGTDLNPKSSNDWNNLLSSKLSEYILFIMRSEIYLSKKPFDVSKRSCEQNENIFFYSPPDVYDLEIEIEKPNGDKYFINTTKTSFDISGFYRINYTSSLGSKSIYLAVDPVVEEFNSQFNPEIYRISSNLDDIQTKGDNNELWSLFLNISLIILVIEWFVTHVVIR